MRRYTRILLQGFSFPPEESGWLGQPQGVAWQPLIDIYECRDALVLVTELPGVDQDDITITVSGNVLRLNGVRTKHIPSATQRVHQMEIPHGPFARVIELPASYDVEHIEAEYDKGYLRITIPRIKSR